VNGGTSLTPAQKRARLRRGMFLLPSLFTVGNIGAGYFAITRLFIAISGRGDVRTNLDWAALAILFAIPFDSLDGRIARMTNTTSEFGKELDSLADVITFGVAPSLLAYIWGFHFLSDSMNPDLRENLVHVGGFICFLFLIGGASRLARFNISHNPQPRNPGRPDRKYFVGMPIPAAAALLAATVHFFGGYPNQAWWVAIIWLCLVGTCGFLMVSTWRFWSGKEINLSRRFRFQTLLLLAIVLFAILRFSQGVLFAAALVYMFSGIWARAAYSWSRRRRRRPDATLEPSGPLRPS
jgi:CDP-diacylglycerol--serine O-phosphatidyltransferase